MTASAPGWNALVLAGSRSGGLDPVARHAGVPLKCLAPVHGTPMLVRVVEALAATGRLVRIAVSLPDPTLIDRIEALARWRGEGRLAAIPAEASPSLSVAAALETLEPPLLVTTADHPLLTPRLLERFMDGSEGRGADIAAGVAPESVIRRDHPGSVRTYLRFSDGGYSGCNLFALLTAKAVRAITFWRRVEEDRKRPWRIARAFGPGLLLAYVLRWLTLEQALVRASRVMGVRAVAVTLDDAEAAIDVDKPADLALVETILGRRALS